MELPALGNISEYIRIPQSFYSFATGELFKNCVTCEKPLLKSGTQYIIEKAIIKYPGTTATDVVFEYAMCLACTEKMRKCLSEESISRTNDFFSQRTNLITRRKTLLKKGKLNIADWLDTCLVTNKSVQEVTEYQIYAHCDGQDMLFAYAPYMLSSEALEEIQELISPETKEILDNFVDEHFGLPPELKKLIKEHNLIMV